MSFVALANRSSAEHWENTVANVTGRGGGGGRNAVLNLVLHSWGLARFLYLLWVYLCINVEAVLRASSIFFSWRNWFCAKPPARGTGVCKTFHKPLLSYCNARAMPHLSFFHSGFLLQLGFLTARVFSLSFTHVCSLASRAWKYSGKTWVKPRAGWSEDWRSSDEAEGRCLNYLHKTQNFKMLGFVNRKISSYSGTCPFWDCWLSDER